MNLINFNLNLIYFNLNLTYFNLNLTHFKLNLTYFNLNLTYFKLNLTYFKLNLTYFNLNLTYFKLNLTYFNLNLIYFNLNLIYFNFNLIYFNLNLIYFKLNLTYFKKKLKRCNFKNSPLSSYCLLITLQVFNLNLNCMQPCFLQPSESIVREVKGNLLSLQQRTSFLICWKQTPGNSPFPHLPNNSFKKYFPKRLTILHWFGGQVL